MGKHRKKFSATESGNGGGGGGGDEDIHAAARSGDLHGVQSICSSNPLAVNLRDKHSRTPLHLAAWSGQTEVVNYLCKNKADPGAAAMDDMGAIHFAAQKGHTEVVKALVSSGISIKACNRKGLNPLHYAVQGDHKELMKYLMRKGASLTAKTKAGKTPLDLAKSDEVRAYLLELEESAKKEKAQNVTEKVEEDSTGQNVNEKNEDDSSPQQSLEDKPIGPPEREAVTKQEEGKEQDNEDDDSSPKQSLEDKPIGPPEREAVTKQEEGKEQDNKDDKVKRKAEEAEIQRKSSEPKKAKIALNHLVAADYDTQEENS